MELTITLCKIVMAVNFSGQMNQILINDRKMNISKKILIWYDMTE
ncbi:MAG: hypothetical protein ACI870_000418 [Crocinitomicaceae bacterium]|jgi:hypothetical protein